MSFFNVKTLIVSNLIAGGVALVLINESLSRKSPILDDFNSAVYDEIFVIYKNKSHISWRNDSTLNTIFIILNNIHGVSYISKPMKIAADLKKDFPKKVVVRGDTIHIRPDSNLKDVIMAVYPTMNEQQVDQFISIISEHIKVE